jgi:hypothetical protein
VGVTEGSGWRARLRRRYRAATSHWRITRSTRTDRWPQVPAEA